MTVEQRNAHVVDSLNAGRPCAEATFKEKRGDKSTRQIRNVAGTEPAIEGTAWVSLMKTIMSYE